jgi:lysophospholipase L1-like esterase
MFPRLHVHALILSIALVGIAGSVMPRVLAAPPGATQAEPTNAAEAAAKKQAAEAAVNEKYAALVAMLSPEEQAWEKALQDNLGSFYLPLHKQDKVAGRSNAWDFVKDDAALPRVLLIGDSVSRGYTQAVRKALAGTANVHRAPANCGPTASGIKNIDAWLASAPGVERWDVIHFNFGIHDRATPVADYTGRLEKIVERLEKTGAKLVWATTTPIPDVPAQNQTAASIVERNAAAATVMEKHGVAIDDLFTFITPRLAEAQLPNDVHFKPEGYDLLGGQVAESIRAALGSQHGGRAAAEPPGEGAWTEDFSDPVAYERDWNKYGFLANGVDAKHPHGTSVSGKDVRPEWWQIVDGALRGQNFPEEHHPAGIWRKISGDDVRVAFRFKFSAGGMAGITVRGPNPIVERDFHVAVLHIRPNEITAADNTVLHPKDSPEAAALKKQGTWNRKFFYAKTEKTEIAPDEWHECVLELRGRELTAFIDGHKVLEYTTLAGDAPKTSIGLQPGGNKKTVMATWFDDIRVAPLPPPDEAKE